MKVFSRPGFYIIALLISVMLLLTSWMKWKLDSLPKRPQTQERAPADVSNRP